MNAASEPYRTALLITMSMSYSRYFSTATPMATHRHKNARLLTALASTELITDEAVNVATTSTAAAANHFSCSRSSPAERTYRTTAAATLTTSAASTSKNSATSADEFCAWLVNGSDQ